MKEEKLLYSKYLKGSLPYYIEETGSSIENLAQEINLEVKELNAIINGEKGISSKTAFEITNWKKFGFFCPEFITEFYSFFDIPICIQFPCISKNEQNVLKNNGMFGWEKKPLEELIKSEIDFDKIVQELILIKSEASNNKNFSGNFLAKEYIIDSVIQGFRESVTPAIAQAQELQKLEVFSDIFCKMEFAIRKAFEIGHSYAYLKISEFEKDLVQKLRMEANKNKNNPEYWANRLEEEYNSQPPKKSEKAKKSDCYYIIDAEFEKVNQRESPSHKTLRDWWKRYFPERWK